MGLKLKTCTQCGQRKMIGKSKGRCKECRRLRAAPLNNRQAQLAIAASRRQQLVAMPNKRDGDSYASRNATLLQMGFATYQDYLQSKLWRLIRAKSFATLGNTCRLCNGVARVIHHLDYSKNTLLGTSLDSLVPLCDGCHMQIEFDGEQKLTVAQMNVKYAKALEDTFMFLGDACYDEKTARAFYWVGQAIP